MFWSRLSPCLPVAPLLLLSGVPFFTVISDVSAAAVFITATVFAFCTAFVFCDVRMSPAQAQAYLGHLYANFKPLVWFTGVLLLWMCLTLFWALNPVYALVTLLKNLGIFICTGLFYISLPSLKNRASFNWLFRGGIFIFLCGCFLLILTQHYNFFAPLTGIDNSIHYNNSAALLLALCLWPVLGFTTMGSTRMESARTFKRASWILVIVFAGIAIFLSEAQAAAVAFVLGGLVFLCMRLLPRIGLWVTGGGAFLLYCTGAFLPYLPNVIPLNLGNTWFQAAHLPHRLEIWAAYWDGVLEKPFLGWGLGASRFPSLEGYVTFLGPWATKTNHHPHNLFLALWFELGLPGLFFGLLALGALFLRISSLKSVLRPYAASAVCSALLMLSVTKYPWQEWWLSAMMSVVLLFCVMNRDYSQARVGKIAISENPLG